MKAFTHQVYNKTYTELSFCFKNQPPSFIICHIPPLNLILNSLFKTSTKTLSFLTQACSTTKTIPTPTTFLKNNACLWRCPITFQPLKTNIHTTVPKTCYHCSNTMTVRSPTKTKNPHTRPITTVETLLTMTSFNNLPSLIHRIPCWNNMHNTKN